jgi:hypothetical protein
LKRRRTRSRSVLSEQQIIDFGGWEIATQEVETGMNKQQDDDVPAFLGQRKEFNGPKNDVGGL